MKAASVTVNDFNGAINFTINLQRGINIIAGENGTGKTRLLQALKSGQTVQVYDSQSYNTRRLFAINPKRNSQRRELNQIIQQMRRDNRSYVNLSTEAVDKHFDAGGYDNYSSFGELFLYYFDKLDRSGGDRRGSMQAVVSEFNSIIESVFKDYEISAKWDEQQGLPLPIVKKRGMEVPITGLSCGEDELFSLVLNLYSLRDQFDIFLIDEPETHLNWHLEKMLFSFLKKFANDNDKQLVIATHSRIVVDPDLKDHAQFLYWSEGRVNVSNQLPKEHREKLLDDAFQSLKIGGFDELTIFCEDESHRDYFDALLTSVNILNYRISRCGSSSNVRSLYRTSISDGGWSNSIFVVDGDGQGRWKEAAKAFIQIPVYCIENYAFQMQPLAEVIGKSEAEVRSKLVELLKNRRAGLFEKSKSLNFLVDLLNESHLTQERVDQLDGSAVFADLVSWLKLQSQKSFWEKIFKWCAEVPDESRYRKFVDADLLSQIAEYVSRKQGKFTKTVGSA